MTQHLIQTSTELLTYLYPVLEMIRMRADNSPRKNHLGEAANPEKTGTLRYMNYLQHRRDLMVAGQSRVVTPNQDTLYSNAWFDLSAGPVCIEAPDASKHFYVLGLIDMYTNPFGHIGTRTQKAGIYRYLLTPPNWSGKCPANTEVIRCPTTCVWMIGRILVSGTEDLQAARDIQDQMILKQWPNSNQKLLPNKKDCWLSVGEKIETIDQVLHFSNLILQETPPPQTDDIFLSKFTAIGFVKKDGIWQFVAADEQTKSILNQGWIELHQKLCDAAKNATSGFWTKPQVIDESFGDNWWLRAFVAHQYIGVLCSSEAIYPMAYIDQDGDLLHGSNPYVLSFSSGDLPPVNAFWSITLYNQKDYMFAPNELNRYTLNDRSPDLKFEADGSLHIYIGPRPKNPEFLSNWLPANQELFYVCLRAYLPQQSFFDDTYTIPAITKSNYLY
jgi:hypothetical protein